MFTFSKIISLLNYHRSIYIFPSIGYYIFSSSCTHSSICADSVLFSTVQESVTWLFHIRKVGWHPVSNMLELLDDVNRCCRPWRCCFIRSVGNTAVLYEATGPLVLPLICSPKLMWRHIILELLSYSSHIYGNISNQQPHYIIIFSVIYIFFSNINLNRSDFRF